MVVFAVFHITNGLELSEKLIKVKKFQYKIKKYLHYCICIILCWHKRAPHTWTKTIHFNIQIQGLKIFQVDQNSISNYNTNCFWLFPTFAVLAKCAHFYDVTKKKRALQSREFSKSQIVENTKRTNRYQWNKATGTLIDT